MFYNVFIEHSNRERQYLIALNQVQIDSLVEAFLGGGEKIRIKGVVRNIFKPTKFIIYSITDTEIGTEQSEVEQQIQKSKILFPEGKLSLRLYRLYGTNITDTFLNGRDWGGNSLEERKKVVNSYSSNSLGKIFISHSSKDEILVTRFIDHILILGLGIKREEIFCTSIQGANIKSGDDFKRAIHDELKGSKIVLQIITKNYKESEICMNEMGAAWVTSSVVVPLVAFPFNYDVGFIHATSQQLKLNSEKDLFKIYDDFKGSIFLSNINVGNLLSQIKIFIDFIEKYEYKNKVKLE